MSNKRNWEKFTYQSGMINRTYWLNIVNLLANDLNVPKNILDHKFVLGDELNIDKIISNFNLEKIPVKYNRRFHGYENGKGEPDVELHILKSPIIKKFKISYDSSMLIVIKNKEPRKVNFKLFSTPEKTFENLKAEIIKALQDYKGAIKLSKYNI